MLRVNARFIYVINEGYKICACQGDLGRWGNGNAMYALLPVSLSLNNPQD